MLIEHLIKYSQILSENKLYQGHPFIMRKKQRISSYVIRYFLPSHVWTLFTCDHQKLKRSRPLRPFKISLRAAVPGGLKPIRAASRSCPSKTPSQLSTRRRETWTLRTGRTKWRASRACGAWLSTTQTRC